MDHLPPPIDLGYHISVGFFARRCLYCPGDFYKYPALYGHYDYQKLLEFGLNDGIEERTANEFLQSWLFFALLAEVLGTEINTSIFLNRRPGILDTSILKLLLAKWVEREEKETQSGNHADRIKRYVRASTALEHARRFVAKHCSYEKMDRDYRPDIRDETENFEPARSSHSTLDTKMLLSIAILGETLQQERPYFPPALEDRVQFWTDSEEREKSWGYSKLLREAMRQQRWCPWQIRRIESMMPSVGAVYYCHHMSSLASRGDHSSCSIYECRARNDDSIPLHRNGCQGCDRHSLPEGEIFECIERGKTPLATWNMFEGRLEYQSYNLHNENVEFGALSHSWSEHVVCASVDASGQGSFSMHECQLNSLQETFNRLFDRQHSLEHKSNVPFWVDILCIPRGSWIASLGIDQMKTIFAKAQHVLIWDRDLLQRDKSTNEIETNVRIRTCDWAQRLWTLQEAILGRHLCVEFKSGLVRMEEMCDAPDVAKRSLWNDHHHVWKAGHPFSSAVWDLRTPECDSRVQLAWEAVQFRLLGDSMDETIILGNILGMDVTTLQAIQQGRRTADLRMRKFLQLLDQTPGLGIPPGIIFLPPAKLQVEGYTWAPRTWLSRQAYSNPLFRPVKQAAIILQQGLLVQFPGMILYCPDTPIQQHKFWVPVNGSVGNGSVRHVKIVRRVWVRLETNASIIKDLEESIRMHSDRMFLAERLLETTKWCIDGSLYRSALRPKL